MAPCWVLLLSSPRRLELIYKHLTTFLRLFLQENRGGSLNHREHEHPSRGLASWQPPHAPARFKGRRKVLGSAGCDPHQLGWKGKFQ